MGEKLGEHIRRKRKERGLGLRATATKAGISAGYLSRIEGDAEKYPPGEEVIRKLAEVLEDDFDEFMALAGRVAQALKNHVREDPKMPEFLRQVRERNIPAEKLLEMLKNLKMGDVLGATWLDDGRICVDQSLEGKEGRFAFTVAHEVGHWVLHRPVLEMEKVTLPLFAAKADEEPKPAIVCRAQAYKQPAEWQADQFAARVLMPASDVRAVMRALHGDGPATVRGLDASRKSGQLDAQLRALADGVITDGKFSNVSNEAMCYRLLDLKLVADANAAQGRLL